MMDAFKKAATMGVDVLLWGRTSNPMVQVVLVKWPHKTSPYVAYCFDVSNSGFYNNTDCTTYADGQAAFLEKLNERGSCDDPA